VAATRSPLAWLAARHWPIRPAVQFLARRLLRHLDGMLAYGRATLPVRVVETIERNTPSALRRCRRRLAHKIMELTNSLVRPVKQGPLATTAVPLLSEGAARGWQCAFDEVVQFHGYVRISLRLTAASRATVHDVAVACGPKLAGSQFQAVQRQAHTVEVRVELLMTDGEAFEKLEIDVTASVGDEAPAVYRFSAAEAAEVQYARSESGNPCTVEFGRILAEFPEGHVLEIGSRARSGVTRRMLFGDRPYVGLDVLPGEGVTMVGDAHALSALVEPDSVDIVFSASVFEHLVMPWKVALEMNKVMRTRGVALIVTHQTCGMHDAPWDFWRFSDTAWHGIFNARTGFEIVRTHLNCPMFVMPFLRLRQFAGYEAAVGMYLSAVLVRKIGPSNPELNWSVTAKDVLDTVYPE
jgi:hypothetical protein